MKEFIAKKIAAIPFVKKAVEDRVDLSVFRDSPPFRVYFGIFLVGISYLIGWPAVWFFGVLAMYLKKPFIALFGPASYVISHFVFIIGMYLAGARYVMALLRWSVRVLFEKMFR